VPKEPEAKGGRAHWGSRLGFVFAATGSAVGLGNIWKFPYITGVYGGGAFVLVYLICILLVGLPLMYSELIIGRRGGKDILGALRATRGSSGASAGGLANFTGILAVAAGFLILSFYSVVAGWAIHFLWVSCGLIHMSPEGASVTFHSLRASAPLSIAWHTVFMLLTILVVAHGVREGIEGACKKLMPALLGILVLLLVYVGFTGGLKESTRFLFKPDFGKLTGEAILEALGHAFFTLSLGMGAMVTYGSYLESEKNVVRDGVAVAVLDTIIALLAGLVIFAVVFQGHGEAGAGPGLVFETLPDLFRVIPAGQVIAIAFFVLVIFAAWSSGISLLEVVVAYFVDEHRVSRKAASWLTGLVIWFIGLFSAWRGNVFDFMDDLTTRYMLPIGGLCIAIFAGWVMHRVDRESGLVTLGNLGRSLVPVWTITIRFITPALVLIVLLSKMGVIRFGE
jgi:NSS family neurotransmitter:Na+ symporter